MAGGEIRQAKDQKSSKTDERPPRQFRLSARYLGVLSTNHYKNIMVKALTPSSWFPQTTHLLSRGKPLRSPIPQPG